MDNRSFITYFKKLSVLLLLILVFLEAGLRIEGFIPSSIQAYRNLQSIKQKGTYHILCLGESTTRVQYPHLLQQILNQRNIGVRFSVVDKGVGGAHTSAILSKVESYLAEYHPDMVVAMMGSNDRGSPMPEGTLFLRSLRTYSLARLLWLHILTKAKEMGFYKPEVDRRSSVKAQSSPLGTGFKETSAEAISTEGAFKKAIEINPKNDHAYVELGRFYQVQSKFSQAEDSFKKAIEINPKNDHAYVGLGVLYRNQEKLIQAEDLLKKAIEINPKNDFARILFGAFAQEQGKFLQAEDIFKKAIEFDPENDRALGAMSTLYEEMGKPELAQEYAEKANRLRSRNYPAITVNNYRKLKEILDRKGIKLVCVQYPVRSVEPLKRIFENDQGIIFVDNERLFKEAVRKGGYKEYFKDMAGGDSGHCTPKGNKLLAQNIANVILREVFHKQ